MMTFVPYEDMEIEELLRTYKDLYYEYWHQPFDPDKAEVLAAQLLECRFVVKQRGYLNMWDDTVKENTVGQRR